MPKVKPKKPTPPEPEDEEIRVEDRRHWASPEEPSDSDRDTAPEPHRPTVIDEYRQRTEAAESKLQEYIEAHKQFRDEQEQVRVRLQRDVERRVQLRFTELVEGLLDSLDDLNLALSHADETADAKALADGVRMARDRFLAALTRSGVEPIDPRGDAFDPHEAEAVRMDPVEDRELAGRVTETLRPGFRCGSQVVRPARVAVGRHVGGDAN